MNFIRIFFVMNLLMTFQHSFAQKQFKALVVTTTKGWHHESLHYGYVALQEMAQRNEFTLELLQDPKGINDQNLRQYQVVIFLNTTGNIFDSSQQKAMERFIQSGNGFVGVHSASDTEYDWEWYTRLVGRMFVLHPPTQTARLKSVDTSFAGLNMMNGRMWTDEYYAFTPEKTKGLNYLLTVDESSYQAQVKKDGKKTGGMGTFHPVAWYHYFDGGRSFYTALGHVPGTFSDPAFLDHLYAGIFWAATGKK